MLHRESGVFKTSYAADMALYPLPIARWTVAAIIVLFAVVLPVSLHEYYLSIINLSLIAIVGALGLNILVGYTGQISVGHAAFMSVGAYTAANLAVHLEPAVLGHAAGRRADGGPDRRHRRHSEPAHQGPLSRHRHAGGPAHHRVDHQPHAGHLRRRAGLDPGAAADAVGARAQDRRGSSTSSCCSSRRWPSSATLNLVRSRIGRAFVAIRDQDIAAEIIGINIFRYKLLVVRHLVVLRRRVRRALHLLSRHRQLRGSSRSCVSIDYLAMIIIGGLGSVLGSILGAIFVTMLPIVLRLAMEPLGRPVLQLPASCRASIASTRLVLFGGLIIFFLVVEPEGLNRLWRNIRNYFRVWPFSY